MNFSAEDERRLLQAARDAIGYGLAHGAAPTVDHLKHPPNLQVVRAAFVTLHLQARLRGCMGSLEAVQPLVCDVAKFAYLSAFSDPRFEPLRQEDADAVEVHISVLSPTQAVDFCDEQDLLAQLRVGFDGLIIEFEGKRATFLPSVWADVPEPAEFLQRLKHKAGIAPGARFSARRYTTVSIGKDL